MYVDWGKGGVCVVGQRRVPATRRRKLTGTGIYVDRKQAAGGQRPTDTSCCFVGSSDRDLDDKEAEKNKRSQAC